MSTPTIRVSYYQSPSHTSRIYGYVLRVKVDAADGMPSKIFVFQRGEQRTNDGDVVDHFINIGSPMDLDNVPEDEPLLDSGIPYYRLDEVTLYFRNLDDLIETKNDISGDIFNLVQSYKYLEDTDAFEKMETRDYTSSGSVVVPETDGDSTDGDSTDA